MTGNSLAYLLSQENENAHRRFRVVQTRKVSSIGNSLAYLLSQETKMNEMNATADVQVGWRSAA